MLKQPIIRSVKHRKFIGSLPCCVTGAVDGTQASHIRTGNGAGMGLKSGDDNCVPLHFSAHTTQHSTSEKEYWGDRLDAAKILAKNLYKISGNTEHALRLIAEFRLETNHPS